MPSFPIISQNTSRMPGSNVFYTNTPVFASGVVKLAEGLNHLAYMRARKVHNVHCTQSHHQTWTQNTTAETYPIQNRIVKDDVDYFFNPALTEDFIFTSSHHARWIGFYLTYEASVEQKHSVNPAYYRPAEITLSLLANPTTTRDEIDAGCKFAYVDGSLENTFREAYDFDPTTLISTKVNQHYDSSARIITSGYSQDLPPDLTSYTTITTPRPLFVPAAYRGQVLALKLSMAYIRLNHITFFEMFEDTAI